MREIVPSYVKEINWLVINWMQKAARMFESFCGFSIIHSRCEAIFSQGVAKERR